MRGRLVTPCSLLAASAILVSSILVGFAAHRSYLRNQQAEIATQTSHLAVAVEALGSDYLRSLQLPAGQRISLISSDGRVLYDSRGNADAMEHHLNRE